MLAISVTVEQRRPAKVHTSIHHMCEGGSSVWLSGVRHQPIATGHGSLADSFEQAISVALREVGDELALHPGSPRPLDADAAINDLMRQIERGERFSTARA